MSPVVYPSLKALKQWCVAEKSFVRALLKGGIFVSLASKLVRNEVFSWNFGESIKNFWEKLLLSKKLNEFIFIHKKVRHEEFKYLRKDNNSYKARKEFLHMEVAVNLDWLAGEMKSPALYGRPDAGLSLNRFNQMVSNSK